MNASPTPVKINDFRVHQYLLHPSRIAGRFHAWRNTHAKNQPSFPVSLDGVGGIPSTFGASLPQANENHAVRNLFKFLEPLTGIKISMKLPHGKSKPVKFQDEGIPIEDCGLEALSSSPKDHKTGGIGISIEDSGFEAFAMSPQGRILDRP